MKKKHFKIIYLLLFLCLFQFSEVNATELKQYTKTVSENLDSSDGITGRDEEYNFPTSVYDFIDEEGYYNSVYTSEMKVYWTKYDANMQEINTLVLDKLYDYNVASAPFLKNIISNFGGAIYYKKHLFVIYAKKSNGSHVPDNLNDNVLAVVKYDKTGQVVKQLEMDAGHLKASSDTNDYATAVPFFEDSNCSLAINKEGDLVIFFGRHMFNDHQSSTIEVVNTDTLEWYTNIDKASANNWTKYYKIDNYYRSHSEGQRVISTSDGNFLFADQGDAYWRGLNITKFYKGTDGNFEGNSKIMVHYREGTRGSNGYNYIFTVMGNLLEVSDGYMYIGAIENTLSRDFGNSHNESKNIFVQKYSKDLETKTTQTAQMLKTPERRPTGTPPTDSSQGRLYLTGTEVDYGIKYLTDLQNITNVVKIKSVKLDADNIAIIWEEEQLKPSSTGYYLNGNNKYYYMIIDKDANIIKEKEEITGIKLSTEENYVYKDGNIYWTTTTNKTATVNVLKVKDIPITSITAKDAQISKGSKYKLNVQINPTNSNEDKTLLYESSNPSVATIDSTGTITALNEGSTVITIKTKKGITTTCTIKVTDYLKGDINKDTKVDVLDAREALSFAVGRYEVTDQIILSGDLDLDNKITATDAAQILKIYLKK